MCGCGRTSRPCPATNCTGPIWSKKMNGPTICRRPCGSARRTAKPSPRSRTRGTTTSSSASQERLSPSTGSLSGIQLMGRLGPIRRCGSASRSALSASRGSRVRPGPAARLVQEPDAPFGFVDPAFEQTGRGHVAVLLAQAVGLAHVADEPEVVVAQFRQHVERGHVFGVVVRQALLAADLADRAQRGAADLACALRDRIGGGKDLSGLFVEQQMVITKMRTRNVPMEVLGLHVESEQVRKQNRQRAREIPYRVGREARRGGERGLASRLHRLRGHDAVSFALAPDQSRPTRIVGICLQEGPHRRDRLRHPVSAGARGQLATVRQFFGIHVHLMKVPLRSSVKACCSSASVFITIGPYQATGSSIGLPDTSKNRTPSSPASTVTSSPRSNSTSERLPVCSRTNVSPPFPAFSVSTPNGCDAERKFPAPSNT